MGCILPPKCRKPYLEPNAENYLDLTCKDVLDVFCIHFMKNIVMLLLQAYSLLYYRPRSTPVFAKKDPQNGSHFERDGK